MEFNSKLFIACPALSNGGSLNWLGDLFSENGRETVHVIACNCDNTAEILTLVEKTIKEMETAEQTMEMENMQELAHLYEYRDDIRAKVFEHRVPFLLMTAAIQKIKEDINLEIANQLKGEQFMYLSSVDTRTIDK